jgi:uncharacterized protein
MAARPNFAEFHNIRSLFASMDFLHYFVLCIAAFAAGAVNSIAGGGTLLAFPALLWTLGDAAESYTIANVTTTIALLPGSVASAWAYRRELPQYRFWLDWLIVPSVVGGFVGSYLLLQGKPETFKSLVPWLILTATLLFALQPQIAKWMGIGKIHTAPSRLRLMGIVAFQLFVSIYGGYFGAGIGILMLSSLAMMGLSDIHGMNAVKTILAALINAVAAAFFLVQDPSQVNWQCAVPMLISSIVGGYIGARVATKLNKNLMRKIIVLIGFALAGSYFFKLWYGG